MKYSQGSLLGKVLTEIKKHKLVEANDTIIVAVSGGPDSVCLLDVLFSLRDKIGIHLTVCHFNHRLRGQESDRDEEFVKTLCDKLGIECIVGRAPAKNRYSNEEQAREARYSFFEKILQEGRGKKVALAHNANDSAETFIQRLVRGTGLNGLRSIPLVRKNFIRPLLSLSRKEIEEYLAERNLDYRLDQTNFDPKYTRNFIRLQILPVLMNLNPNLIQTLFLESQIIESDYALLEEIGQAGFKQAIIQETGKRIVLNLQAVKAMHPALQRMVLRLAIAKIDNLVDLSVKQLFEVESIIKRGVGGKFKALPYHSLRVEIIDGKIIVVKGKIN